MTASELDIDEEYKSTLRTRSYQNMLKEVGEQLRRLGSPTVDHEEEEEEPGEEEDAAETEGGEEEEEEDDESTAPSAHLPRDFLVPAELDRLVPADGEVRLRGLLRDYLDSGLRASAFCYQLLESIAGARANHRAVQRIVEQRRGALWDLVRIARLDNPLSQPRLSDFLRHHGSAYAALAPRSGPCSGASRPSMRRRAASTGSTASSTPWAGCWHGSTTRSSMTGGWRRPSSAAAVTSGGGRRGAPGGEDRQLEQLQELEERVLLCLLTITRAWNLLQTQGLVSLQPVVTIESHPAETRPWRTQEAMEREKNYI
ncbi:unnamed protein product [Spirodela intermedia]|uniref:Uncharacterized protein n=1 Tax=Spirodela intermedia TaxID=51605 RepID=A0A7I8IZD8_SPIIN|nr:unnamed protein product [Spirodela intermedia]CAA6663238.1 unnamed protein product [Spirodela intermedia]